MNNIACDIIIPVMDQLELTRNCLESIRHKTRGPYNVIVVDNNSSPVTGSFLKNFASNNKNFTIVNNNENLGWVRAVNQGIKLSKAPYVCVMNNDTIVETEDWLRKMIAVADLEPGIGLVNPRFDIKNRTPRGVRFLEIDFCRGYCVLIKRPVIERIGSLDEAYGMGYYDDDDYSVRAIRAGFKCVRANDVVVRHLRDSTFSSVYSEAQRGKLHEANKKLFYSKWGKRLNIFFISTAGGDRRVRDLLVSLARKQHVVYLRSSSSVGGRHINIREKVLPKLLLGLLSSIGLAVNNGKSASKRYDLVFFDDAALKASILKVRPDASFVDTGLDMARIDELVDAAARV